MAPLPGPLRGWGSARCGPEAGTGSQVYTQNPAGSHPHVCLALIGRAGFQACPRVRAWIRAVTCCPDVENLNNFGMRGPTFAMGHTRCQSSTCSCASELAGGRWGEGAGLKQENRACIGGGGHPSLRKRCFFQTGGWVGLTGHSRVRRWDEQGYSSSQGHETHSLMSLT